MRRTRLYRSSLALLCLLILIVYLGVFLKLHCIARIKPLDDPSPARGGVTGSLGAEVSGTGPRGPVQHRKNLSDTGYFDVFRYNWQAAHTAEVSTRNGIEASGDRGKDPPLNRYPGDPKLKFSAQQLLCNGTVSVFNNFLYMRNALIDPRYGRGKEGGEALYAVINQPPQTEVFTLLEGYFTTRCEAKQSVEGGFHLEMRDLLKAVRFTPTTLKAHSGLNVVVALVRQDYANFYHAMMDLYSVFLILKWHHLEGIKITILWLDGHPKGGLDSTWSQLFGHVVRAGSLKAPVLVKNLFLNGMGRTSPLNDHKQTTLPFVNQFRKFFLSKHNISDDHKLDCRHLNVLFVWRRDYAAHAQNPSGLIRRKITNEEELLAASRAALPRDSIRGVQLDELPMKSQLEIISRSDVLVGVHGAGLTHALFLPGSAGLIELYPVSLGIANKHFRAIAQWRHLLYMRWQNRDRSLEKPSEITIPVHVVRSMLEDMRLELCSAGGRD